MTGYQLHRDKNLDILRGYSIFAMVLSNLAGEVLISPHPLWLRIIGSTAAPIFILISGFLLSISFNHNNHKKSYYLKRGFYLLLYSSFIDIFLWHYLPLVGMDVLYLIGIATMLSAFLTRLDRFWLISLATILFLFAPILQFFFGYGLPEMGEWTKIGFWNSITNYNFINAFKQWFISGWFPIFPWLGVFFIGLSLGKNAQLNSFIPRTNEKGLVLCGFLFFLGITIWELEPKIMERGGYSELFYPPSLSFFLVFLSIAYFLFAFIEKFSDNKVFYFFSNLGQVPLLLYISHLGFIIIIENRLLEKKKIDLIYFLPTFLVLLIILSAIAFLVRKYRNPNWKLPVFIKMLFG